MVKYVLQTEQMVTKAILQKARKGKIYEGSLVQVKETITKVPRQTGWDAKRFNAWVAKLQTETGLQIAYNTKAVARKRNAAIPHMPTQVEMELVKKATLTKGMASMSKAVQRVMRWVRTRCAEENGVWKIQSGHMATMKKNLVGGQRPVKAAVLYLIAQGLVRLEDRESGPGNTGPVDWKKTSLEWAMTQEWITPAEGKLMMDKVTACGRAEDTATILELGLGWEGATEGLQRVWERVVTMDKVQQAIAKGRRGLPSVLGDFKQAAKHKGGVVKWLMSKTMVTREEARAVWASPSCKGMSKVQGMEKANGRGQGWGAGKQMNPQEKEATNVAKNSKIAEV